MSNSSMARQRLLIQHCRPGMTLIEMLIATTITLIIMAAVAEVFGLFGAGVSDSRSVLEMNDQMRAASYRLRQDLAGVTAATLPPLHPEQEQGYFEYIEGLGSDANPAAGGLLDAADTTSLTADCDDVLLFTTRSTESPFVGRFTSGLPGSQLIGTIESPVAEIGWFCRRSPTQVPGGPTLYTLYRRKLLVLGYAGADPFYSNGNSLDWATHFSSSWQNFYEQHDVSAHLQALNGTVSVVPNTLGDLTKRENRFLHFGAFPSSWDTANITGAQALSGSRLAEDVILTNILAFDVRAFDPHAPLQVRASGVDAVSPGDPGFDLTSATAARGAYVDLGWNASNFPTVPMDPATFPPATGTSVFQTGGVFVSKQPAQALLTPFTYDTWSSHYETDGIDQNGDGDTDEGTNGFDDDADDIIDESDESETSAPYPVALRGLEIRIRCYEPSSRQVRQVTVRHTFVPH